MMVDEQNAQGGLLGRPVEAVVVDPASDWPLFAERARELLESEQVDVVFGCWTSVSRKSVLPVFRGEQRPALLPGPVRGRGVVEERHLHRRRPQPAGDTRRRLPDERGRHRALGARGHRLRLSPHHQPHPRGVPEAAGRGGRGTSTSTTPPLGTPTGRPAWPPSAASARPASRPRWCRPSTATPNVPFYLELANQEVSADDIPVVAFLGGRGGAVGPRHRPAGRAPSRRGTTSRASSRRRTASSSPSGRRSSTIRTAPPTTPWRRTTSGSTCGRRRSRRRARPTSTRCWRPCRAPRPPT